MEGAGSPCATHTMWMLEPASTSLSYDVTIMLTFDPVHSVEGVKKSECIYIATEYWVVGWAGGGGQGGRCSPIGVDLTTNVSAIQWQWVDKYNCINRI